MPEQSQSLSVETDGPPTVERSEDGSLEATRASLEAAQQRAERAAWHGDHAGTLSAINEVANLRRILRADVLANVDDDLAER